MEIAKNGFNQVRLQAAFLEQMIQYAMPQSPTDSGGEFDFVMNQALAAQISRRLDFGLDR